MAFLADELMNQHSEIIKHIHIGYARWDDLIARVSRQERTPSPSFDDEQIWTFLVACGYAISGISGVAALTRILTRSQPKASDSLKIWFEVLPIPSRKGEGESHIDLALGTIDLRQGTESGIQLAAVEAPWVCFCEMKWYSDISSRITHDIHRNQLARVIENALCFQKSGRYAEKVFVTLVTPSIFHDSRLKSRLYQYKFEEYNTNRVRLLEDLDACILDKNDRSDWSFPNNLPRFVSNVPLQWATYDELFENVPDSAIAAGVKEFWLQHGDYQGRSVTHDHARYQ